jgi:hypothetical protein
VCSVARKNWLEEEDEEKKRKGKKLSKNNVVVVVVYSQLGYSTVGAISLFCFAMSVWHVGVSKCSFAQLKKYVWLLRLLLLQSIEQVAEAANFFCVNVNGFGQHTLFMYRKTVTGVHTLSILHDLMHIITYIISKRTVHACAYLQIFFD